MVYDEGLADRVSQVLDKEPGLREKRMFGGIGYMIDGHMACGVLGDDLIVRVGRERYTEALELSHTRVFDTTGRAMTGWVMVEPEGTMSEEDLGRWVEQGVAFARSLPSK